MIKGRCFVARAIAEELEGFIGALVPGGVSEGEWMREHRWVARGHEDEDGGADGAPLKYCNPRAGERASNAREARPHPLSSCPGKNCMLHSQPRAHASQHSF